MILNLDDNLSVNLNSKKSLECSIVENGGSKVQNYLPSTTHVISSKIDIRTSNLIKKYDINIFSPKWLFDCIKYNKLIHLSPLYLVYVNKETQRLFLNSIDKYNDSYVNLVTKDSLLEIFKSMKSYKEGEDINNINNIINNNNNDEYKKAEKAVFEEYGINSEIIKHCCFN